MTVWLWRAFSLLAWAAWLVFIFRVPNTDHDWWVYVAAVVLTLTALLSLQKVGL